jgi:DNA-binding Lrp family transcriptional regulator
MGYLRFRNVKNMAKMTSSCKLVYICYTKNDYNNLNMRLSEKARTIVAYAGLHADVSPSIIAKKLGLRVHTVRYTLEQLSQRGAIKKRWVIDLMACGWMRYEIFFALAPIPRGTRQKMIEWLIKHELCTYMAEVGGEFDYEVILLARSSAQIQGVLTELSSRFGEVCFRKVIAQHTRVSYFPRKYLTSTALPIDTLQLKAEDGLRVLDKIDHSILHLLSENPTLSQRDMSKALAHAPLTIARRLQDLSSAGVLRGAMYSLDSAHTGAQNFILLIFVRGFRAELTERLYRFSSRHPNCTNMKECLGSWDFEIGVEVPDARMLRSIKEELLERFAGDIVSITVLSRFATLKYRLYPFLANEKISK